MLVVKLGGSLLGTPELKVWLDILSSKSVSPVVIVPGGGIFADAVRDAQKIARFDDDAAHRAALLAMEQYALVLKALQPLLATASSKSEILEHFSLRRSVVWLPSQMVLADEEIPKSWDVTSDSLAAWLAERLGATGLWLVKHAGQGIEDRSWQKLMRSGILDAAFEQFANKLACPIQCIGKASYAFFNEAIAFQHKPALAE